MASTSDTVKQAGGGVSKTTDPASFHIGVFENVVMDSLVTAYKTVENNYASFKEFLDFMSSDKSNAMGNAPDQDLQYPLCNYFISSSHNTYLTGHQLYGKANVDGYKNVLLRGCRCVEIDVWDGEAPSSSDESSIEGKQQKGTDPTSKPKPWRSNSNRVEPVVLHGYTATKDISFRQVCEAIRDYAFVTSNLPVIVSLEVHTSHEQQQMMVEIMDECFKGLLVDVGSASDSKLPSPKDLERKILIKVKYSPPMAPEGTNQGTSGPLNKVPSPESYQSEEEEPTETKGRAKTKPSKIIEALSQLGIYTRSYHFKSLDQPEATIPTHVFSLSENALMEVHKGQPAGLFDHNKCYLMRAYPRGTRVASSNLDPAVFWRKGVQMVALNWQRIDAGVMLNEGMFVSSGGWVLKPERYRSSAQYSENSGDHGSKFSIEFLAGQNIEPPKDVEADDFKPYVKCELHIEIPENWESTSSSKEKDGEFKDKTKHGRGIHPKFKNQVLKFENLPNVIPELGFVRFKVMHEKFGSDPLAAWACIRLDRLQRGFRFIHLFDSRGVQTKGAILAHLNFEWKLLENQSAGQQSKLPLR